MAADAVRTRDDGPGSWGWGRGPGTSQAGEAAADSGLEPGRVRRPAVAAYLVAAWIDGRNAGLVAGLAVIWLTAVIRKVATGSVPAC